MSKQEEVLELRKRLISVELELLRIKTSRLFKLLTFFRSTFHKFIIRAHGYPVLKHPDFRSSTKNYLFLTIDFSPTDFRRLQKSVRLQSNNFFIRRCATKFFFLKCFRNQYIFHNIQNDSEFDVVLDIVKNIDDSNRIVVFLNGKYSVPEGSLKVIEDLLFDSNNEVLYSDIHFVGKGFSPSKSNVMPEDGDFISNNVNIANGFIVVKNLSLLKTLIMKENKVKHNCINIQIHKILQNSFSLNLKVVKSNQSLVYTLDDESMSIHNSCDLLFSKNLSSISTPIYRSVSDIGKGDCSVTVLIPTMGTWTNSVSSVDFESVILKNLKIIEAESSLTGINTVVKFIVGPELSLLGSQILESLRSDFSFDIIKTENHFNFSERINLGKESSKNSDYFLLMNDDIILQNVGFLRYFLSHFSDPAVGIVGARLIYPDGLVQHAGVTITSTLVDHYLRGFPVSKNHLGHDLVRQVSGVTAALCLISKKTFDAVGDFSTDFPIEFGDIDYMLKVSKANKKIIYDPRITALHLESSSRGPQTKIEDFMRLSERWDLPIQDPFYIDPN